MRPRLPPAAALLRRRCSRRPSTIATSAVPSMHNHHAAASSSSSSAPRSFPAYFARGGTSNGLVVLRRDLPARPADWAAVLPRAMGSPDPTPHARQLDGMGSGASSTSKVCVLSASSAAPHGGADVDFTFVQVGIRAGELDTAGNCGNMSAAVGPVALEAGLVGAARAREALTTTAATAAAAAVLDGRPEQRDMVLRIFNTNTQKVMLSRFRVAVPTTDGDAPPRYVPQGDYAIAGVPGTGSRVSMSFLDPAGAKTGRALPTRNPVDALRLADGNGGTIQASLVDVSNPGVFVRGSDLGLAEPPGPDAVEADPQLKARLAEIRRLGAARMGLDPRVESVPKIVVLFPPRDAEPGVDIRCFAMSMGQAHKAVPLTLALCLGAATRMEGTIAAELARKKNKKNEEGGDGGGDMVTIGHPSGTVDIGTTLGENGEIISAELHRTARILMKGEVYY